MAINVVSLLVSGEIEDLLRPLSNVQIYQCLKATGSIWQYGCQPDASKPHALLTSGKHSDGYVNVGGMLKEYPSIRRGIARTIAQMMKDRFGSYQYVVGADTSSTELAGDIAEYSRACHIRMVKTEDGGGKRQVWKEDNQKKVSPNTTILHVEELITTTSSALQVRAGIRLAIGDDDVALDVDVGGDRTYKFARWLPCVVERSNPDNRVTHVEQSEIVPLLRLDIRNFEPTPDTCPYCVVGSEAIKPKEGNNWNLLTGK